MAAGWSTATMGEVAPLVRRPVETVADTTYREIGIRSFGKGVFHKVPTTGLEIGSKRVFAIEPGDLLFNIVFAWEGAVAVAGESERGMIGSHRFLTCVTDKKRVDARFLNYWFSRGEGRDRLLWASPGGAGRNRTLGIEKLGAIEVPLPPLDEQRRIVARIDDLAAKIAEARGLKEEASAGATALSRSALALAFKKAAEIHGATEMASVATCAAGFGFPREYQGRQGLAYPFFKVSDMNLPGNDRYMIVAQNWIDESDVTALGIRTYPAGTTIFPKIGGAIATNKRRQLLGAATFDNNVMGLIPGPVLEPDFLYTFLLSVDLAELQAGTSVPALSQAKVEKILVPTPPLPEQRRIVAELDTLQAKVDAVKRLQGETSTELDALLPAILDRAFKGEL